MNVLSLFDGMRCGRIALDRAGIKVTNYFSSEVDHYAIDIADKNFPMDANKKLGDVRYINTDTLPDIDLLIGGSPCQNFSFSGTKKGMTTSSEIEILTLDHYLELKEQGFEFEGQSYLFWEFVRILKDLKPRYFLLENVKMSKKWEAVLSEAVECNPIKFNSSLVSAQNRERLYWTNIDNIILPCDKGIVLRDVIQDVVHQKVDINRIVSRWNTKNYLQYDISGKGHKSQDQRAYYLEGKHGTIPARGTASKVKALLDNGEIIILNENECELLQTLPINYTEGVPKTQRLKMIGNGWTVDVIAHIFSHI